MAAPVDGLQDPYLSTLELSTSEYLKIYNKEIVGLPESDRYDLTISKWTEFCQELEDIVSTFVFKSEFLIAISIYAPHVPT